MTCLLLVVGIFLAGCAEAEDHRRNDQTVELALNPQLTSLPVVCSLLRRIDQTGERVLIPQLTFERLAYPLLGQSAYPLLKRIDQVVERSLMIQLTFLPLAYPHAQAKPPNCIIGCLREEKLEFVQPRRPRIQFGRFAFAGVYKRQKSQLY